MTTDLIIGTETENVKDPITNAPAHQNPTSRNKSTTSQQKRKNESDTEGFHKVPKHLTFKPPKGHTSVSNPFISFPTNPQPTDFPEDPAPPAPLARRPRIPPFFVLAKND
ncbi:hypothetical protein CEXT_60511 [Caerostris extrusa]|uniref:Uncharacterized protein n=1 Tax=Caerostris extrusa TaxID=172846 RepID=A0AAV4VQ11_CAEEX|nr:hypothetical protein CEXT_60511 [Caerostris extrusa]